MTPSHACSCRGPASAEEATEFLRSHELAVIGAIVEPTSDLVEINVEAVYSGKLVDRVTLNQPASYIGTWRSNYMSRVDSIDPSCGYTVLGDQGERYFLSLSTSPVREGTYEASGCASFAIRDVGADTPGWKYYLEALPRGGGPPLARDSEPLVVLALGVLGPLAFLAGAAFVWRRGESHNG